MKTVKLLFVVSLISVIVVSCKKDDNSSSSGNNTNPAITTYNMTASIDGVTKSLVQATTGANYYCSSFFSPDGSGNVNVSPCAGMTSLSVGEMYQVKFDNNNYTSTYYWDHEDSLFRSAMHSGSHAYSNGTSKGVVISWYDTNGDIWSSNYGTQTGSLFNVTSSVSLADDIFNGWRYHEIKFTFNGKLYNEDGSGTFKTLTGGSGYIKYEDHL